MQAVTFFTAAIVSDPADADVDMRWHFIVWCRDKFESVSGLNQICFRQKKQIMDKFHNLRQQEGGARHLEFVQHVKPRS